MFASHGRYWLGHSELGPFNLDTAVRLAQPFKINSNSEKVKKGKIGKNLRLSRDHNVLREWGTTLGGKKKKEMTRPRTPFTASRSKNRKLRRTLFKQFIDPIFL